MACQPVAVAVALTPEVEPADRVVVVDSAAEVEDILAVKVSRTGAGHVLEARRCSGSIASFADCLDLSSLLDSLAGSLEVARCWMGHCTLLGAVHSSEDTHLAEGHTVQA